MVVVIAPARGSGSSGQWTEKLTNKITQIPYIEEEEQEISEFLHDKQRIFAFLLHTLIFLNNSSLAPPFSQQHVHMFFSTKLQVVAEIQLFLSEVTTQHYMHSTVIS